MMMAANDMPDIAPSDACEKLDYFQSPSVFGVGDESGYELFQPETESYWNIRAVDTGSQPECHASGLISASSGECPSSPDGEGCVGMWKENTGGHESSEPWVSDSSIRVVDAQRMTCGPGEAFEYTLSGGSRSKYQGTYTRTNATCNGRAAYQMTEADGEIIAVLYQPNNKRYWNVASGGDNLRTCPHSGVISSADCPLRPDEDECSTTWKENTGDRDHPWVHDATIAVTEGRP